MWSWLKLGRARPSIVRPPAPPAPAAPAGPRAVSAPPPPGASFVAPEAAAQGDEPLEGLGHRRPLVGRDGQVAGFELMLNPATEQRLLARGDSPSVVLHYSALLTAAAAITAGGRLALLRMPALLLNRAKLAEAATAQTLLVMDELGQVPPEVAAALRARGVRLGVRDGPPNPALRPDFVVLEAGVGGIDTLLLSAQRWREALPQVTLVGLGMQHLEDLENALRGDIALAGGQLGQSRDRAQSRPLGAAAHRIFGLLNHLAQDRDTAVIADEVRADATLTYRLLRYANSPAIGLKRAVEVVDDAVQLLGRAELQRWLSVQLLSAAKNRHAARALEEAALVRGRILEDIARTRGDPNPGAHFTLGLLSLIEPLLQVPVAEAIAPLRLGDAAKEALLRRAGPWADRVLLLEALDAGDAATVSALASGLGVEPQLSRIVDDAWRWEHRLAADGAR